MTLRRLAALQWIALLLGSLAWAAQHVLAYGVSLAECEAGGRGFGIDNTAWQASLMAGAIAAILVSLAAAVLVFVKTGDTTYNADPPEARIRFFAITALPINVILLMIVLLDGSASIFHTVCRQG
jgi:hypothetical protein